MKQLLITTCIALPFLAIGQVTLDTNQVKVANQTYIYAKECKGIKDDLFIQLDSAISLIEQQRAQIERYDTLSVIADAKYSIINDSVAKLIKIIKKAYNPKFYIGGEVGAGALGIYSLSPKFSVSTRTSIYSISYNTLNIFKGDFYSFGLGYSVCLNPQKKKIIKLITKK